MRRVEILYVENDMILEVSGVSNGATGDPINTATITATIYDEAGTPISGETWPKSVPFVTGIDGTYRTTLPTTLAITEFQRLTIDVDIDAGAGLRAHFSVPAVAQDRA